LSLSSLLELQIDLLPKQLRILELTSLILTEKGWKRFEQLPLSSLRIIQPLSTPALVNLPKSITKLSIVLKALYQEAINLEVFASLPVELKQLSVRCAFAPPTSWFKTLLPRSLEFLSVITSHRQLKQGEKQGEELNAEILRESLNGHNFRNLTYLYLSHLSVINDAHIANLPHRLTFLHLSQARSGMDISLEGLSRLPKSLTTLSLPSFLTERQVPENPQADLQDPNGLHILQQAPPNQAAMLPPFFKPHSLMPPNFPEDPDLCDAALPPLLNDVYTLGLAPVWTDVWARRSRRATKRPA
jgi:hypothetical protein